MLINGCPRPLEVLGLPPLPVKISPPTTLAALMAITPANIKKKKSSFCGEKPLLPHKCQLWKFRFILWTWRGCHGVGRCGHQEGAWLGLKQEVIGTCCNDVAQYGTNAQQLHHDVFCSETIYYFQPKLSSAKSRLNVESFLAACRKLGLPEVRSRGAHFAVCCLLCTRYAMFVIAWSFNDASTMPVSRVLCS